MNITISVNNQTARTLTKVTRYYEEHNFLSPEAETIVAELDRLNAEIRKAVRK